MERHEKLKLLRGLYCLTQEEMAVLANNCHRSVYSSAEAATNNSRKLTDDQASALNKSLRFDEYWFNGISSTPLQYFRFAYIDLDWSQRHLAATTNVRCRRINDAERAVKSYLPSMLIENGPVKCSIGKSDGGGQLFFFLFEQQGLLLRTIPGQQITEIIEGIQTAVAPEPQVLCLPEPDLIQISMLSSKAILGFLSQCNLDGESIALMQPEIELVSEVHFNYKNRFGETVRESTLKAICREIMKYEFTIKDVEMMLNELRQDKHSIPPVHFK